MWIKKELDISNISDYLYGLASRVWWSAKDDQRNTIWELVLDTFGPTESIDETKLNDFIAYNCIELLDEEDDRSAMYDISKYIKEYKDRNNKCEFCAYHNIQGGRCYMCKNHNWFVQEINLKQYLIKRVSEDSTHEFKASEKAIALEREIELRKNVYDDFTKYVEKQKEILDNELELKRKEWSELASDYALEMGRYSCNNIDRALESLDFMEK